jgi:transcriptional regulator of acetoin/glycerol metabolism
VLTDDAAERLIRNPQSKSNPHNEVAADTAPVTVPRRLRAPSADFGVVQIFPAAIDEVPTVFRITRRQVLGRARPAELLLPDTRVSRRHAELARTANGIRVRDLSSKHGVYVNGSRLSSEGGVATAGDILRVGNTLLLVTPNASDYCAPPRQLSSSFLGTATDVVAGPLLQSVWQQAISLARLPQPVLVVGESGSGKEAVARLIHATRNPRAPLVVLNASAIPPELFESELFGHERGAFTGSVATRSGAFRDSDTGVLFLDEIGDLRIDLQVKLLRAIESLRFRPLGARQEVSVQVKVVAATNRDLSTACATGLFRLDLYHRLSGFTIQVPPLSTRPSDLIAVCLLALQNHPHLQLSADVAECLVLRHWRGNVRELLNVVARAAFEATADQADEITPAHLSFLDVHHPKCPSPSQTMLTEAFQRNHGNAARTALALGISRATLYNLFRRYGMHLSSLRKTTSPRHE